MVEEVVEVVVLASVTPQIPIVEGEGVQNVQWMEEVEVEGLLGPGVVVFEGLVEEVLHPKEQKAVDQNDPC